MKDPAKMSKNELRLEVIVQRITIVAASELLKVAECPDSDCDEGVVSRWVGDMSAEVEYSQCQWCAERKEFVDG